MNAIQYIQPLDAYLQSSVKVLYHRAQPGSLWSKIGVHNHFSWGDTRATAHAVYTLAKCGLPREHLLIRGGCAWLYRASNPISQVWSDEAWDTALALRALHQARSPYLGAERRLAIKRWFMELGLGTFPYNLHDELWETCFALRALTETVTATPKEDCRWIEGGFQWLQGFSQDDGRIVTDHYTALVILALEEAIRGRYLAPEESWKVSLDRSRSYLLDRLRQVPGDGLWSRDPWANGYILQALAPVDPISGCQDICLHADLMGRIVDWLDGQERSGWLHDPEDLSEIILGMRALMLRLKAMDKAGGDFPTLEQRRAAKTEVEERLRNEVFSSCRSPSRFIYRDGSDNTVIVVSARLRRRLLPATTGVVLLIGGLWQSWEYLVRFFSWLFS